MGGNSMDEDDFTEEENISFTEENYNPRLDRDVTSTERSSDQVKMEMEKTNDFSDCGAQFESPHASSDQCRSTVDTHSPFPLKSGIETGIPCSNVDPEDRSADQKKEVISSNQLSDQNSGPDVTPMKCAPCGETFVEQVALERHMNLHYHNEDGFKCTVCNRPFRKLGNLHNHIIKHSVDDSPHACKTCGKKFPSAEILDIHNLRTHPGLRFPCSVCDLDFGYRSVMVRHMKTHTQVNHIKSYTKSTANCSEPADVGTQEAVETDSNQESREQQMSLESPVQYSLDVVKTEVQPLEDDGEEELEMQPTLVWNDSNVDTQEAEAVETDSNQDSREQQMSSESPVQYPLDVVKTEVQPLEDDGEEELGIQPTLVWNDSNVDTQEAVETDSNQDSREQQMSSESPVQYPLDVAKTEMQPFEDDGEKESKTEPPQVWNFSTPSFDTLVTEMQPFEDDGEEELKTEPPQVWNLSTPSFDTLGTGHFLQDDDPVTDFKCPLCSIYFQDDGRLDRHIQRTHCSHSASLDYPQCPACDKRFEADSVLKIHVQFHLKSAFNCLICGRVVSSAQSLDYHLKRHRYKPIPSKCPICHKTYADIKGRRKHMRRYHANIQFKKVSVKEEKGFDVAYCGADELYEPMCELRNSASKQTQDPLSQTENDCKQDLSTTEFHSDEATVSENLPEVKMEFFEDDCKVFKKELSD